MTSPRASRPAAPAAGEDAALVARLKAGDERAFESVIRLNGPRMLAAARRILANEEDARDAVQEAFLSGFRSIERFQGGSRLSTWLHRIAINAALMRLRALRRSPEQEIDSLLPRFTEDGHHEAVPRRWSEAADEPVLRDELRSLVRASIERLPDTYRVALLLRDIEELTNEEVAEQLGVSVNAAKIRVHRARLALRHLLDRHLSGVAG